MRSLLTIKAWQLFVLIFGLPCILGLIPLEMMSGPAVIIVTILTTIPLFGWFYALGNELPKYLPHNIAISSKSFRYHIWYLVGVVVFSVIAFGMPRSMQESFIPILVLAILYYVVAIFIVLRFIAKVLASVELGKLATGVDYTGYFFLLYFSPVGIWVIQPKIQKIIK